VSVADHKAEKILHAELARSRPGYGFVFEEGGRIDGPDKSHSWFIDPLDGTTNFLHGLPVFAISIALARDGQIVAGLVHNPATGDMFVAQKGQGAYRNNRRLRVAARRDMADSLIGCGIPHLGKAKEHPRFFADLTAVMAKAGNLRRLGSAALDLCFVAAGFYDGFWERNLQAWDIAAGILIVKEAGGFVTDADGGTEMLAKGSVCAGNDVIHRELLNLIRT
jgi:myo-inositol-1(or 4)-monophosphatase